MVTNDAPKQTIASFGRKYLWWEPVGDRPHSEDRIIAQIMRLGTHDDILLLEQDGRKIPSGWNHAARGTGLDELQLRSRTRRRGDRFMPQRLEPKLGVLPAAQREIWTSPAFASDTGSPWILISSDPNPSDQICVAFGFINGAAILQDAPDALVVLAETPSGPVKISFFGGIGFGRVDQEILRNARDRIGQLPDVVVRHGSLTGH